RCLTRSCPGRAGKPATALPPFPVPRSPFPLLLLLPRAVVQLDAAVAGPAVLARGRAHRTLLAVADHVQLAGRAAVRLQRGGDRVAAALAQAEVVLAAAALVGIALEGQARGRAVTQVLGVAGHRGLEFRTQGVLVEVEVDGALPQAAVGIQVFRT